MTLLRDGPFRGAEGTPRFQSNSARFGSKLSDSLDGWGRGVNTEFPSGVLEGTLFCHR